MARRKQKKVQSAEASVVEAQRAAAESLQSQIDELVSGKGRRQKPENLRDFINDAMARDTEEK